MEESALEEMLPVPVEGGIRFMEDMSGQLLYFRQDISEEPWQQERILELRQQIQEEKKGDRLKIRFGGEEYEVDYDDYKYCPNCGQRLDWEENHAESC